MQRGPQNQEVVVVAIDINRRDDRLVKFASLSSNDQLKILSDKIQFICDELGKTHSNARWIIAWRDYGITGVGLEQRTVSGEFKNLYKQALADFVKKYPNLTIVAGTVATEKKGSKERLERITQSYHALSDYHHEEKHTVGARLEAQEFDRHIGELEAVKAQSHQEDLEFRIIRNTCYVFTAGNDVSEEHIPAIRKHSKTTPQGDSSVTLYPGLKVFHPGDTNSKNPIIDISGGFKIATEVCREHDFKVAKTEAAKQNIPQSDVLIHFVISDTIKLNPKNFHGIFVLQLDSINKPRLIVADSLKAPSFAVTMYQVNLLEDKNILMGPLAPLPELFQDKIEREFTAAISKTKDKNKQDLLKFILAEFMKSSESFTSSPMYEVLEKYLNNQKIHATLCHEDKKSILPAFIGSLFGKSDMQKWIERILVLVAEEKKQHPEYQAYVSQKDSPKL